MPSPLSILQQYWHYNSFRPQQEGIIQHILDGRNTLAVMPTGGGKSICYQVPGLLLDGICLVISPLIALMKDQVDNLQKRGVAAAALHSGLTHFEITNILRDAVDGGYKFLYVSPERLQTDTFLAFAADMSVSLIAVDEAHCISQWGYDFRPSYLKITNLTDLLPGVPVLAVTASATPVVEVDIIEKLRLEDCFISRQSFERANLSFSVFKAESKINKLVEILTKVQGSSIVYCRNRKTTKQVAELLQLRQIQAAFYHAGLLQDERVTRQEAWVNNHMRVIVCTNAFGMGIDKPDVRTVVHYDVPECMENYYQEAGRAGRDGKKAYAVLLYNHNEDELWLETLPDVRFPSIYNIRKVYQALADYLQIPVGIGQGNYYDFDIGEFTRNFGLDTIMVINTLKVLEQEGHLTFNESILIPPQVSFTASRGTLHEFEQSHPVLDVIVKCLLRTYEGIYDNRVSINEKLIARLTRKSLDVIKGGLLQLKSLGIIDYIPRKETPQINFTLNRAPAEFLYIDNADYFQRKHEFELRTGAMLNYMRLTTCRSKYIANYFGDNNAKDCGVCDNCLSQKNKGVKKDEFKEIEEIILTSLADRTITIQSLLANLSAYPKEKAWKVIEYLQAEHKITADNMGRLNIVK